MEFPQKIKNGTAFSSSDPTSGTISEETQNTNSKEYVSSYVIEYYAAVKMKENLLFATGWTDLEIMLSEIRQRKTNTI